MKYFRINKRKFLLLISIAVVIIAIAIIYPIFQLGAFGVGELGFIKYKEELIGNPKNILGDQEAVESEQDQGKSTSEVMSITVEEVYEIWSNNEDYTILDVRTPEEYNLGHIEGVVFIPDYELEGRLDELSENKPIIVYCCGPDCGRSALAVNILIKNGFSKVYEMSGGFSGWQEKDYPIVIGGIPEKEYGLVYSEPGYKEYDVKLSRFSFSPEVIRVDRGDKVRLNFDSVDVVHGVEIDGYDINVRVPAEKIVAIEFIANKAGSIRIRCSIPCGSFHPFMIGNIIVGPNINFLWAFGLAIIIPIGTLGLLLAKNNNNNKKKKEKDYKHENVSKKSIK